MHLLPEDCIPALQEAISAIDGTQGWEELEIVAKKVNAITQEVNLAVSARMNITGHDLAFIVKTMETVANTLQKKLSEFSAVFRHLQNIRDRAEEIALRQ